jgi:16S rRNA (cytosine967-C5)-methyltransferase
MTSAVLGLAAEIIRTATRERPADRVIRETLRSAHGLEEGEPGQVSRAVFAYYRWLGWLDGRGSPRRQIEHALELAERFAREPLSFADVDLVQRAVPDWVRDELEVTPRFVRALQAEPRVWLRARAGQGEQLAKGLHRCAVFPIGGSTDALEYLGARDLFRTAQFHSGAFELQDLHSQAVGFICAPRPGETWWDACAGEGGKLLHLSELMQNRGLIWASDRAEWRLRKLKRRAARAGVFNYRVAAWDGGGKLPTRTKFDGVLLDAPCSGIGTWHRNPHARWTTTPQDVRELAAVQRQLLGNVRAAVKPGGRLVYSVCTLTRSETAGVIEAFGRECPGAELLPIRNPLQPALQSVATVTLRPEETGGNGMFVAAWKLGAAA